MDADTETPESREFTTNRWRQSAGIAANVAAILSIARAYVMSGRPNALTPLASFEEWSRLVHEPLIWLGCADPVATMDSLRQTDPKAIERQSISTPGNQKSVSGASAHALPSSSSAHLSLDQRSAKHIADHRAAAVWR